MKVCIIQYSERIETHHGRWYDDDYDEVERTYFYLYSSANVIKLNHIFDLGKIEEINTLLQSLDYVPSGTELKNHVFGLDRRFTYFYVNVSRDKTRLVCSILNRGLKEPIYEANHVYVNQDSSWRDSLERLSLYQCRLSLDWPNQSSKDLYSKFFSEEELKTMNNIHDQDKYINSRISAISWNEKEIDNLKQRISCLDLEISSNKSSIVKAKKDAVQEWSKAQSIALYHLGDLLLEYFKQGELDVNEKLVEIPLDKIALGNKNFHLKPLNADNNELIISDLYPLDFALLANNCNLIKYLLEAGSKNHTEGYICFPNKQIRTYSIKELLMYVLNNCCAINYSLFNKCLIQFDSEIKTEWWYENGAILLFSAIKSYMEALDFPNIVNLYASHKEKFVELCNTSDEDFLKLLKNTSLEIKVFIEKICIIK